jgi:GNAT superfamily N-acetyltransferase
MQDLVYRQRQQNDSRGTVLWPEDPRVSIQATTLLDKERLREMFSRLSSETIYRRFHLPYSQVPERILTLMLNVDHHDNEAFLAVVGGEVVGHAMYVRLENERCAEVAFVVEDGWQSRGIGKLLLSQIAEKARARGVEYFTGGVLEGNQRVLDLLDAVFTEVRYVVSAGLYQFRVPLRTLKPTTEPVRMLRRAV